MYSSDTTETPTLQSETTQATELGGSSTITAVSTISPYLKPGASYYGKTSSTRCEILTQVKKFMFIKQFNLSINSNH